MINGSVYHQIVTLDTDIKSQWDARNAKSWALKLWGENIAKKLALKIPHPQSGPLFTK